MKATRETKTSHYCQTFSLAFLLFFVAYIGAAAAQTDSGAAKVGSQTTTSERDGQHDFDFALGTWKAHLKRLEHPLTGSKTWVEFDGTFVARKVWDGRANVEEVELNSPTGPIEGLTLGLYKSAKPAMQHLLGEQQEWCYRSFTSGRSIQERTRRVLRHRHAERQAHLRPLRLD